MAVNKIWVRIIGDHVHVGEEGYVEATNGKVKVRTVGGVKMYEVYLLNCPHLIGSCFATMENLRRTADPETWHSGRAGKAPKR